MCVFFMLFLCFLIQAFFLFVFCLFSKEKEGMVLDWWGSGKDLGGDGEGKP